MEREMPPARMLGGVVMYSFVTWTPVPAPSYARNQPASDPSRAGGQERQEVQEVQEPLQPQPQPLRPPSPPQLPAQPPRASAWE